MWVTLGATRSKGIDQLQPWTYDENGSKLAGEADLYPWIFIFHCQNPLPLGLGQSGGGGLKFEYYFTGGMRQVKNVNEL